MVNNAAVSDIGLVDWTVSPLVAVGDRSVCAQISEPKIGGISPDQLLDGIGGERHFQEVEAVVADRTEQPSMLVSNTAAAARLAMTGTLG